jgi:molecular chaperone IbpA
MLLLLEDVVMRQNFDFAPLFGSTVGFDRVFDMLQSATVGDQRGDKYPPYDIERSGPDAYRITLAVAGFDDSDLTVTTERNLLLVEGNRGESEKDGHREFLHRGIGARAFRQQFQLADHVKVAAATLANGLLTIDLVREIPEVMRPRQIPIASKRGSGTQSQIAAQNAA